jgi:hypothetical protein
MSYYSELIFAARLRKSAPIRVITNLRWLIEGDDTFGVEDMLFVPGRNPLKSGSDFAFSKIWWDEGQQQTVVSVRSEINNIDGDIEAFLDWIGPYVEKGAGIYNLYAVVTGEEGAPRLYYLTTPEDDCELYGQ